MKTEWLQRLQSEKVDKILVGQVQNPEPSHEEDDSHERCDSQRTGNVHRRPGRTERWYATTKTGWAIKVITEIHQSRKRRSKRNKEVRELEDDDGEYEIFVQETEIEIEPEEKEVRMDAVWSVSTPLPSPPAAMLAVSIRPAQDGELLKEETVKVWKADGWKVVFCARTRTGVAGKVDHWVITKA